ncbi:hypothetical protein AA0119_g9228 [Alternaria tenuissima]|uniref:Heterokaryon incompatibility domain-containing protein n=1 Tax=Alternaria tenuissima TaxID=119927 RepID=A0ABY0G0E7_9PLEO|nr:hypothetical protein AA0119_g9228 [Alternaria tenuissima]
MRLLQQQANGDTDFSLVEFIDDIPPYAILSHTWGADHEEVTFKDIYEGKGKARAKPGYEKLRFCAQRATKEQIGYFWVPMIRPLFFFTSFTNCSYQIDTCCIDKSSSAELTEAINSMYKWYKNSTVCYVYLSDVPRRTWNIEGDGVPVASLLGSRWFTRGWTFQELLAPRKLIFFAANGETLGRLEDFADSIAVHCKIPLEIFHAYPRKFRRYGIGERLRWTAHRQTKREEDAAYCLLGCFDVQMPLIYGEGRTKAFVRLRAEYDHSMSEGYRKMISNGLPEDIIDATRGIVCL